MSERDFDAPANWLAHRLDGKPQFSPMGIALLYGVLPERIYDPQQHPLAQLSDEQKKAGRRRTKEAQAASDSDELIDVLRYWARVDLGLDVVDRGDWVILCEQS